MVTATAMATALATATATVRQIATATAAATAIVGARRARAGRTHRRQPRPNPTRAHGRIRRNRTGVPSRMSLAEAAPHAASRSARGPGDGCSGRSRARGHREHRDASRCHRASRSAAGATRPSRPRAPRRRARKRQRRAARLRAAHRRPSAAPAARMATPRIRRGPGGAAARRTAATDAKRRFVTWLAQPGGTEWAAVANRRSNFGQKKAGSSPRNSQPAFPRGPETDLSIRRRPPALTALGAGVPKQESCQPSAAMVADPALRDNAAP